MPTTTDKNSASDAARQLYTTRLRDDFEGFLEMAELDEIMILRDIFSSYENYQLFHSKRTSRGELPIAKEFFRVFAKHENVNTAEAPEPEAAVEQTLVEQFDRNIAQIQAIRDKVAGKPSDPQPIASDALREFHLELFLDRQEFASILDHYAGLKGYASWESLLGLEAAVAA